jgi:hypothetical protein
MKRIRSRLSYANVMAALAVFGVLAAGSAFAASQITSKDIQNGTIVSKDVQNQSLFGRDVAPDSLNGDDIDESTLACGGAAGIPGCGGSGPEGPKGDQGGSGPPGPTASTSAFFNPPGGVLTPISTVAFTPVMDLDALNSQPGSQQITTTFPARIIATGAVVLTALPNQGQDEVRCQTEISDGTGPTSGLTPMGDPQGVIVSVEANDFATIPIAGAAVKPPGTYNVQISCQGFAGNSAFFQNGQLDLVAAEV